MQNTNFDWKRLGDVSKGRSSLGIAMPVVIYRLMQYTMLDELAEAYGPEKANVHFYNAGYAGGRSFTENVLHAELPLEAFLAELREVMQRLRMGIFRMEEYNPNDGSFVLTISEDLDCSGLPITGTMVCHYDEGFLAGIFEEYTGKKYSVTEIDCWATGNRCCRFKGSVVEVTAKST